VKVCFLTLIAHPNVGGSTKYFYEVVQRIKRQGHEVTLVCSQVPDRIIDVDSLILVKHVRLAILQPVLFGLLALLKLRNAKFDVYCYESGYIGPWAILFKLSRKGPLVSFSMRYGLSVLAANLRSHYLPAGFRSLSYVIWEILFFTNEVFDVCLADRVVVLSEQAKRLWVKHRIRENKVGVIPFGIDLNIYQYSPKKPDLLDDLDLQLNDKVVLYVGHLQPGRNVDKLIQAFAVMIERCRESNIDINLRLVIVGSGVSEGRLRALVSKLALDSSTRFVPHVQDECRLNDIYNIADLFVLPNVPGTTALLAMPTGVPIVTIKNNIGILGAITDEMLCSYVLLDSTDPVLMSQTCLDLLTDEELRNGKSQATREVISHYSWDEVSLILGKYLGRLANQKTRGLGGQSSSTIPPQVGEPWNQNRTV
jgi:glycosyltransferase involved in cell wall biosynthesis